MMEEIIGNFGGALLYHYRMVLHLEEQHNSVTHHELMFLDLRT